MQPSISFIAASSVCCEEVVDAHFAQIDAVLLQILDHAEEDIANQKPHQHDGLRADERELLLEQRDLALTLHAVAEADGADDGVDDGNVIE